MTKPRDIGEDNARAFAAATASGTCSTCGRRYASCTCTAAVTTGYLQLDAPGTVVNLPEAAPSALNLPPTAPRPLSPVVLATVAQHAAANVAHAQADLTRFRDGVATNPLDALERGYAEALVAAHAAETWGRVAERAKTAEGLRDLLASQRRQLALLTRAAPLGASAGALLTRAARLSVLQGAVDYLSQLVDSKN